MVALGPDGSVWMRGRDGVTWTGWTSLGGRPAAAPSVASPGPGRLDVFAPGSEGQVWHRWWEDGWHPWEDLGGSLAPGSAVSATSGGDGRLDLYAVGADNGLWHRRLISGTWQGWERVECCGMQGLTAAWFGFAGPVPAVGGCCSELVRSASDGLRVSASAATTWAAISNVIASVPFRAQEHALSCEAASLQMALAREHIDVSQDQILADIGVDSRPAQFDSDGQLVWGDPYQSFVGDPDGEESDLTGYGTYYPTISRVAARYGGEVLRAAEGVAPQDVYSSVREGHPVVAWVSVDRLRYDPGYFTTFDGRQVQYQGPIEHALTVAGVDGDSVYVLDPLYGPEWISKDEFENAYASFNQMAVILA
jgi:uncharacterized protein YvpB